MSRTDQWKAVCIAGLSFIFSAVCEIVVKNGPWWYAMIAVAAGLILVLVGFVCARRAEDTEKAERKVEEEMKEARRREEWETERAERNAAEAKQHEIFLNESVSCEACSDARLALAGLKRPARPIPTFPRRQLWRLPEKFGGKAVCSECFKRRTGKYPVSGSDKRAFE